MDLGQLRVFHQVAKLRSFAAAAEALFVTPPAVSIKVKQLEDHYGVKLFERAGRRVELTDAGEVLLGYAERVFTLVKEADSHLEDMKGGASGTLKISTGLTVGTYHLAPLINTFSRPDEGQEQEGGDRRHPLAERRRGLRGQRPRQPEPRRHPALEGGAGRHRQELALLRQDPGDPEPLIVREKGSGTREYIEARLRRHGVAIKTVMEIGSDEAIKRAVAVGLGISIVPVGVVAKEVKRRLIKPYRMDGETLYLEYFMIWHKDKYLSNLIRAFMDATVGHFKHMMADPKLPPGTAAAGRRRKA